MPWNTTWIHYNTETKSDFTSNEQKYLDLLTTKFSHVEVKPPLGYPEDTETCKLWQVGVCSSDDDEFNSANSAPSITEAARLVADRFGLLGKE